MSAVEKLLAGDFPPVGPEEKKLLESFFLDYAREISTDGGKTAKIKGAIILIDQPLAQPKNKKQ